MNFANFEFNFRHDNASLLRRASSPTGNRMPTSVGSPSHIAATPDSNGTKHVVFAPNPSVPDTPFANTLKYFKQLKGKENSPSKARRNASLPEEIAELAKEAQQEDALEGMGATEGNEDLEQYREMDLGPLDPVMEDGIAGDLIMLGTPTKPRVDAWMERNKKGSSSNFVQDDEASECIEDRATESAADKASGRVEDEVDERVADEGSEEWEGVCCKGVTYNDLIDEGGFQYELEIPGHYGDLSRTTIKTRAALCCIAMFIRQRGRMLEAAPEDIEAAVQVGG
ncbi:hypothetical protein K458DRAFT_419744 [Lentithecium fluviatile CBS 122367]|uniref:Uncharacterized protein n=1 Tax=Lentithecium fluviatile CBS 122367 TaxID=1168545 RepID=A0A6G1IVQ9_9PLEO|nr:hypothetical protein K458DRAFT_419744 [Lentithecium fluviatile CBS 122367]